MLNAQSTLLQAAIILLGAVFVASGYARNTNTSISTTTTAAEEVEVGSVSEPPPPAPDGCPPPRFPRCPPPPPAGPLGPPGPPHGHHPPPPPHHHHPPPFPMTAPKFMPDLNIGNLTAYSAIAHNFSLTKAEIETSVKNWLKDMPKNVQEEYDAWQVNITQCKDEFVTEAKANLSVSAAELFDLIEAVIDDQELTSPETCGEVLKVINNASLAAIDELQLDCFIDGNGRPAHGPMPPLMPGCHLPHSPALHPHSGQESDEQEAEPGPLSREEFMKDAGALSRKH